jgi:hypothetical protein
MKPNHAMLFAALVAGVGAGAPALADPPPWAPAHGHRAKQEREYRYVYYPAQQVYYAPEQQVWFWMNGGNWQVGVNLPAQYQRYTTSGIQVTLASDRPYVEHAYVEEHYGRPWRANHKHGDHDDREHGHGHRDR